jgi:hypothetical protein
MSPVSFLALLAAITAAAWAAGAGLRHRRRNALRRLAAEWQMRYVQEDLFNLAGRIAPAFPIPDVSDVRVVDLIYGSQQDRHRYVFTAEYTLGREDRYRRDCRAATFCEPKEPGAGQCSTPLVMAPGELPIVDQYEHLKRTMSDERGTIKNER